MWADPSLLSGPIFPLFLLKVPGTACHLLFHQYFISTLLCSLHRHPVVSSLASFTSLLRSHSHCVPSGSPLSLDDTSSSYSSQFSLAKMDSKTCKVSSNALSTCLADMAPCQSSSEPVWPRPISPSQCASKDTQGFAVDLQVSTISFPCWFILFSDFKVIGHLMFLSILTSLVYLPLSWLKTPSVDIPIALFLI